MRRCGAVTGSPTTPAPQTAPSPPAAPTVTIDPDANRSPVGEDSGLSSGGIAGIVIASLAGAALLAVVALKFGGGSGVDKNVSHFAGAPDQDNYA